MRNNRILLPLLTLCITAMTVFCLSGCNKNTETDEIADRIADQYTKEQVLDFFETVALQAEYSSEDMPLLSNNGSSDAVIATVTTHPLVKWTQDTIYYTINGEKSAPDTVTIIRKVITDLNEIPNLPEILPADEEHSADLTIEIGTQIAIQSLQQTQSNGFNTIAYDLTDYHITRGAVYLYPMEINDTNMPANTNNSTTTMYLTRNRINHIITEELTQTMGLPNDCTDYPESILDDDANEATSLSDLDKLILIMMYSDKFTNGMSAEDALTQAGVYLDQTVFNT